MQPIGNISKEDAKKQFDELTNKLGLIHTFSFDEVYDLLMERRLTKQRQKEFRTKITEFEKIVYRRPDALIGNAFPLEHSFGDGTYIRKLTIPAGVLTVTKIHAVTHPFFLMKGKISIYSEQGVMHHEAPYHGLTLAGTKRIIYHHTDVEFITVHPNPDNEQEIEKIEDRVTVKTFEELPKGESLCHL